MTKKNNFLMLNLDDDGAKDVANILANKKCSKILDLLTEKEMSEEDISKELEMPISTVHYNLKQLVKAGLIITEKYRYSKKGKEIKIYAPANKFIIIAPKGKDKASFLEQLRNIIPSFLILGLGALGINWMNSAKENAIINGSPEIIVNEITPMMADEVVPMMARSVRMEEPVMYAMSGEFPSLINEPTFWEILIHSNYFWFFLGAILGLGLYFLIKFSRKKFKR